MKNRQNEQHINSQDRLTSLLKKEMPDAPQVVRFDPSVFLKSKVLLPDVSKQNMNSPQSTTSFSKESIIALVATNNIKRVFHSRTLSITSQLPPNEPSFALPTPTKASLANTNVIDISETGSNNDFQTTMYSSMVSNKKREISRLLIIPQRTTSAQKHSPSMKSHKNSVELDLPQTERPQTAQNNPVQDNYKKTLGSFFTLFDKNRTIEKPAGQQKRLFGAWSSQPASPVSTNRKADSIEKEKEKTKPQRPLAIKPTEALNFGVLKLSETPLSNRSKRNLKISTPSSSHKPGKTPSPKHQSVEDSTKGPESGKLQSSENITRTNSGVTSEISSVKKEEPYTVSKIELPESQIRIGPNNSKIEVGSSKSLQRKNTNEHKEALTISKIELPETPRIVRNNSKIEVGSSKSLQRKNTNENKGSKTIFNEEDKNNKVKKVEDNHLLKIQPGAVVKLHKQNSIDLTLQASTKPTSPRETHKDKVRQVDPATKDANPNSMSNTLLTKQGTLDSQNQKNDTSQAPTKRPINDFLAETPKEPNSANVPGAEGEKEKKMNEIRTQRRSSFGEVFSLIQKQQITRRNSSYRNLTGLPGGNLLQNLFPDSKKNETEPENSGTTIFPLKKRHSLMNMTLPVKLKIALPSDDNTTQGGGESTPKHGTPKHIKIITPHNLHIDLGVFSTAVSPKNRRKSILEGNPTKPIKIELEGNQSSITSQYTNSADASRSGFSPLVDSMTPSPVQDKNRLGLPRLSLNGLSPCFSDRSAQLNHGSNPPELVGKKGKKSFAQVCKQVIDIRRSHKSRMPAAIDTKGDGTRKSKENEVMSADSKNKRRLSKTSELIMVGLPSSPGGTVREYGSFRTARAAEDYISGRKKVAFSNKESSIRELSLLRSIIKDNEEVNKKEKRSSNKGYSLFGGGNNKLKTPGEGKGPKGSLSKSDPASPRESHSDIPASATSLQPPTSRSSISFKKPKFTKTFSQKSVFAKKKGEFKKIQSNNFVVKFPKKEGDTESNLKLNFKSKQKRREYHKTETLRKDAKPEGREELSKIFLGNLNRADRNNIKSPNLDKIKSENFVFNEGLDKQKTIDFSTLLQNDDDESIKAYPMRSISRTGSYRSDNSKIIMLSHRDRERDNANTKMVIKITAPNSEGNVNLLAKPKGANDEELPEGCKKFEYVTKSKRKRNLDAEIEFSPFDGLDDMNDYVYNDDTYMGDSLEIARAGFNWAEQAKYFSKAEQHGKFLRFFDTLCHKNTPYFAKSFEDISGRYINENFNDRAYKQIFNKKLVFRLINPISTKMQDIYRNEDDEGEIALFNSTLVGKCYVKSEIFIKSCESVEDFLDDIKDYNVDLTLELRGVPYLRPKTRKALKGPHGHKHLLSQIDDRVQMKVFEEMRPTIEDYIMLNGVNMKEISRKEVYPQITKVLEKTSIKNSDYISKLNFLAYRELLSGDLQSMYYIKSFDIKLLKDFIQDDGSTNQKAMVSTRKIIRNPSVMKLPPKRNSESQEPQRKGASLLRSAVEKMNIEREKTKLKLVKDESGEANKSDLDDSSDNERTIINSILKRKNKKLVPLSMLNPEHKPFSAPVSPNRTPDRVNISDQEEDQLNYSRSSLIVSRRKEGLKSPNSGTIRKLPETTQQPKSLLWKTITMNNAHLSHSPSRFKQVVIDVMKKKSEEKKQMTQTNIPSMTKLNESRMSQQLPTPRKGSHHIKFDDKKTISTDETKMDKGALRMRTQAQTHTKKKNFTISQHIFWAVQENREAELRELFVFCPLSLLDKTDENGDNLLGIASQCGFTTIFHMLLDKGVNVNIPNANGDTPLHLALAYGNYDIADKLLALGARQNVPNKDGKFPWDLAR